jgi:hypothetical protein
MIDILRVSLGEDDPAVKWDITDYVVREDDLDYDERHLLSTALSVWDIDRVSEPSPRFLLWLFHARIIDKSSVPNHVADRNDRYWETKREWSQVSQVPRGG